jgi:hypothetical protein
MPSVMQKNLVGYVPEVDFWLQTSTFDGSIVAPDASGQFKGTSLRNLAFMCTADLQVTTLKFFNVRKPECLLAVSSLSI